MRMGEVAVTSAAVVFQAIADDLTLLSGAAARSEFGKLLETSAKIIRRLRRPLITYTRHIGVMPPGTHILACNDAINVIVRSVVVLAGSEHVAQHPDCPSRKIMTYLKEVCDANWEKTFEDIQPYFDQYEVLWAKYEPQNDVDVVQTV